MNDLALSRLHPDAPLRVLDVGCGAGRTVLDFARYLKRGVVLGRGSHSFPFQLNLSSSVHRITQLDSSMCAVVAQVEL